jgi:hypothetical protein
MLVLMLCARAQAPHVRCSQAAAAVGDDVFFFGGSYYKCAPDCAPVMACMLLLWGCWGDCTCAFCTLSGMLGLRVIAGCVQLFP